MFLISATLALNFDNINNHPEKISKIRSFIGQYNLKDQDFPVTSKDWRKFELNNKVTLNILFVRHNNIILKKYNLHIDQNII